MKTMCACACCGVKEFLSYPEEEGKQYLHIALNDPILHFLQLTQQEEANYLHLGEYRNAISVWPQAVQLESGSNGRFWLHPELVEEGQGERPPYIKMCKYCHGKLKGGGPGGKRPELPEYSIANGVDFGNPDRLQLPDLSLVEMYLLSPVRLYGSVIKLKAFEKDGDVRVLNGHMIAFLQLSKHALAEIRTLQYPRVEDVRRLVSVSFLGDRGQVDRMLNGGDSKIPRELTVRPDVVYKWLAALSVLNPELFPPENVIPRTEEIECRMLNLSREIMQDITPVDKVGQRMNEELESDTARVRFGTQQQMEDVDSAFQDDSGHSDSGCGGQPMAASLLRSNADTIGNSSRDVETSSILQAMRDVLAGPQSGGESGNTVHRISREQNPVNEFTENKQLLLGAFPVLFLLGKGLKSTGSVSQKSSEHMLLQFHGHFARNRWLLFARNRWLLPAELQVEEAGH